MKSNAWKWMNSTLALVPLIVGLLACTPTLTGPPEEGAPPPVVIAGPIRTRLQQGEAPGPLERPGTWDPA